MGLVVYGKPNCPACVDLKRALDMQETDYGYIDVTQDADSLRELLTKGFKSVPQVKKDGDWVMDLTEVL